jgi:energy-coupling factor transporter ATP-binding protein EcfA2
MRIEWIRATAFGGLRRGLELTLEPGLNLITGPNGSGKTTWHAALYAALCGRAPNADGRLDEHQPLDGHTWEVEARIRHGHDLLQVSQDLTLGRASTVTAVDDGSLLDTSPDTIDLMTRLGLDRDAFAATGWIEQDRRPQRPDAVLVGAVDRHLDEDGVERAEERLGQARADAQWRLRQAGLEYERCLKAEGAIGQLTQQRDALARDAATAEGNAIDAAQRHQAAEAVLAEREVRRLSDVIDRLEGRPAGYPGPTPGYGPTGFASTYEAPPPSTRDTAVHHSVADAWRTYEELKQQHEAHRTASQPNPPPPPPPGPASPPRSGGFFRRAPAAPVPARQQPTTAVDTRLEDLGYAIEGAKRQLADVLIARDHPAQPSTVDVDYERYRGRCGELADRAGQLAELRPRVLEQERLAQHHRLGVSQWLIDAMRREEHIDPAALEAARDAAQAAAAQARTRLAEFTAAAGSPAPSGLGEAKALVDRLRAAEQALTTAALLLGQARAEAREQARLGIQQHLRGILPDLTEEATRQVEVGDNLEIRLVRRDGKVVPGPRSTVDEYGVLCRVALGYHLIGGPDRPPLLLDDVTSTGDPGRTRRLLDRLYQSAANQQIVVFAHDPVTREWAEERPDTRPRLHVYEISSIDEAPTPA